MKKLKKPIRKKSKAPISKIQRQLWEICKQLIRKKYSNTCYTCSRTGLSGSNWHTGHLWPKASLGAYLKYDLRVLRPQCYHCNINLGGNGAIYYKNLMTEIGPEKLAELERDRNVSVKAYDHYLKLIGEYQELLKSFDSLG